MKKILVLCIISSLFSCMINYDWTAEFPYFDDFEKLSWYIEEKIEYESDKTREDEFKKCYDTWIEKKGDCEDKAKLKMLIWFLQHGERLDMVGLYWMENGKKVGHAVVRYNNILYHEMVDRSEIIEEVVLPFDLVMTTEARFN